MVEEAALSVARAPGRPTFVDLFSGCGGLSLGLMFAGWRGLLAVEKDRLAFQTLRHNLIEGTTNIRYEWPAWFPKNPCNVASFARKYARQIAALHGHVDLIAGCPPCQGFSLAGRRKAHDYRNKYFRYYLEVVKLVRPPLLIIENVRGIDVEFGKKRRKMENKKIGRPPKPYLERLVENLQGIGYHVYHRLVKSCDFGVPQIRPRYIIIGINRTTLSEENSLDPFNILMEKRTEFLSTKGLPSDRPLTVGEAISDLESHGKRIIDCIDSPRARQIVYESPITEYQKLLHGDLNGKSPNSLRLANHSDGIRKRFATILETCRHGVQISKADKERLSIKKHCVVPLDKSRPSHTLTTLPEDLLHYSEPRTLTVREFARLQSFPDWFEFKGKYATGGKKRVMECPRYTQVGNAVPPFLAEILGYVLLDICNQYTCSSYG